MNKQARVTSLKKGETPNRYLIIGGSAGGASMVAKLRRKDEFAEITLIERTGYVATAYCGLAYGIGGIIPNPDTLIPLSPEDLALRFNATILTNMEAVSIDRFKAEVIAKDLQTGEKHILEYDKLILAMGAQVFFPPVEGVNLPGVFGLRDIYDMKKIMDWIAEKNCKNVAIVGGGFIGLEAAESLVHKGIKVAIIELAEHVLSKTDADMANILHHELEENGVHVRLNTRVQKIEQTTTGLNVKTNGEDVSCDMVLMFAGTRPVVGVAREAGVTIGVSGGIHTLPSMQTSDPDIYCIGDAAEVRCRVTGAPILASLAAPLAQQAGVAAKHIMNHSTLYGGALATFVCKVFSKTIASTGVTEKTLQGLHINYSKVLLPSTDHIGFYPGAQKMVLKVLFDSATGQLLGAQCVGGNGVDRRIDVIATAIYGKMTIEDLCDLELAYAPPYGSPRDPVNLAGSIGRSILHNKVHVIYPDELDDFLANDGQVIDLREPEEFDANTIKGAVNIPESELRARMGKIDVNKPVAVLCRIGSKATTCHAMLKHHGFDSYNIIGGHSSWKSFNHKPAGIAWEKHAHDAVVKDEKIVLNNSEFDRIVDATGLTCPGPIMLLKKQSRNATPGERVLVRSSDGGFLDDFKSWCTRNNFEILRAEKRDGLYEGGYRS